VAREYVVVDTGVELPYIRVVYDEPGVSWQQAKKQLRQIYLEKAKAVRAIRKQDVVLNHINPEVEERPPLDLKVD